MQMNHENDANEPSSNRPKLSYLRFVYMLTCAASQMEILFESLLERLPYVRENRAAAGLE